MGRERWDALRKEGLDGCKGRDSKSARMGREGWKGSYGKKFKGRAGKKGMGREGWDEKEGMERIRLEED